jgi:hypothetical protein
MTPVEVMHRAQQFGRKRGLRLLRSRQLEVADAEAASARWLRVPQALVLAEDDPGRAATRQVLAEAARIAAGEVRLFSTGFYSVGRVPQWQRCPLTGVLAPSVPSHSIALTDRAQVGDIKFVWELNRHLHWVSLAQAHALGGGPEPLQVLGEQLRAWLQQCPPGIGPNWSSSLEYALRLINWAAVWQLIDGERSSLFASTDGQALLRDWMKSIQHHLLGIAEQYSRHSSANNHLIGELAGVFVGAQTWPCWPRVRALRERARRELEQQIVLQTTEDGVNREQAFEYAAFVYDFFAVVERCAAVAGQPMSVAYLDRMAAMCCFIRSVMDGGGHVPQVGDADGAQVLRLHPDGARTDFAAMLHKGALLFGRPDWVKGLDTRGGMEAHWFYAGLERPAAQTQRQPGLSFLEGGYQLFEMAPGTPREIKGLVDAGPLGYLGIAAHGHADALQLCLSVGGRPLLVDPGTYSYWHEKCWRDYFRGTAAHNTVRVAELDQSVSGGRFMWTRKAAVFDVQLRREPDGSMLIGASHDGYRRLSSRFEHRRTVSFQAAVRSVEVLDVVRGRAEEWVELHWHIHPEWVPSLVSEQLNLRCAEQMVRMRLEAQGGEGELALVSAHEAPPLGWYSESYNVKQPLQVLRWRGRAREITLRTLIQID